MAKIELRQELKLVQHQKLVLTQKLKMSLEMLQMPSIELEDLIETELKENPLLEISTDDTGSANQDGESTLTGETSVSNSEESMEEEPHREDENESDPLDIMKLLSEDENYTPCYPKDEKYRPELTGKPSLTDHLLMQVYHLNLDQENAQAVEYVIYSLDHHGLLTLTQEELETGWNGNPDVLSTAVETVKNLDPTGVGCRSAEKALELQLREKGTDEDSLEFKLVTKWFKDVAEKRYPKIARAEGVSPVDVQKAVHKLEKLNPWPGSIFSSDSNTIVIPDVIIDKQEGKYIAFLNRTRFNRLKISRRNRIILESPSSSVKEKEYVKKKLSRASWFLKSIEQRQQTILRIASFLAEYQTDFFEYGISALNPLTLQHVADEIGNNQSTISRAINGKWIQTPRGIYEMRFFFSRGLLHDSGSISTRSVKQELKKIIESEDPVNPFPDIMLAEHLQTMGIDVKRRTVANYRIEMGIPSARKRRHY